MSKNKIYSIKIGIFSGMIVVSSFLAALGLFLIPDPATAADAKSYDAGDMEQMLAGWKAQVDLLYRVGGVMVAGESAAIIFLTMALIKSNALVVTEVKVAGTTRTENALAQAAIHAETIASLHELRDVFDSFRRTRPCLLEKFESSVPKE